MYDYQADEDNNNIEKLLHNDIQQQQQQQQLNADGGRVSTAVVSNDKKLVPERAPASDVKSTANNFEKPTTVECETRQVPSATQVSISRPRHYEAQDAISHVSLKDKSPLDVDRHQHSELSNAQVTTVNTRYNRTAVEAPERNSETVDERRPTNDRTCVTISVENRNLAQVAPPRHEEIFVDRSKESSSPVPKTVVTELCLSLSVENCSPLQTVSHDCGDESCDSLPNADGTDGVGQTIDADWLKGVKEEREQPQQPIYEYDEQITETKISPTNSALPVEHRLYIGDNLQAEQFDQVKILK